MRKHLIMAVMLLSCCLSSFGQQITKFMGIPVDGTKKEMIQKLEEKGFERVPGEEDYLEGEFNGEDVFLLIKTNNNKVCDIVLIDKTDRSVHQIRKRFNNLYYQFKDNKRYEEIDNNDVPISDEEEIAYEMETNGKRYEAMFYQVDDHEMTEEELNKFTRDFLDKEYGIDSLTIKELQKGNEADRSKVDTVAVRKLFDTYGLSNLITTNPTTAVKDSIINSCMKKMFTDVYKVILEQQFKRSVYFTISKEGIRYRLYLFYENGYNKANGEDL